MASAASQPAMALRSIVVATVLASGLTLLGAQAPAPVPIDTSKIGPQAGQAVPAIDGVDQFGKRQSLSSIAGPRGTMLVFFRSADW
jgi:hypothetical protein